ncbi:S-adenosyl-L-methionine-dependent methyltransferase [Peziza echinospora]|nr:S-adenosyl-L-methionine-dependent methyltransferase [Peziza echinospora]
MSDETLESSFKHLFPPSKHGKKKAPKQQSASIPKETKVELELHILQCGSTKVTPGKSVELDSGEFLRVQDIRNILTLRTVDNHILNSENILTGKLFKRARELNYLKHDFNEVAMIEVEAEANSNEVKGIVKLVVTNAPKPHFRGRGWLICRWIWDVSTDSKHEGIIRRVSEHEADENYKFQDSHLRDLWRKAKVEAYEKEMAERKAMQEMIAKKKAEELKVMMEHAVDLTGGDRIAASPPSKTATAISSTIIPTVPLSPPGPKAPRNTYTLGDAFCGGGGASCGARLAGFRIRWGVDHNDAAISTYRANFPEATSYHASIDDFLTTTDSTVVDVAHLSPPCQPYSPAHTIAGKNDESNQAALFAIGDTLRHCRPRMATLEQTPGILHHDGYFLGMIRQFTDLEFSVTFKILKGVEYGLPQDRKRLFVMAAGPGESLPSFPPPTHSPLNPPPPPLLPAATLAAAISPIPPNATEHNFRPFTIPRPPYNADRYFRYTIMAGGGEYDAHPSGLRSFTVRELSCIQGFPMDYQFVGGYMQKKSQVGNAVPPILGRKVMEMVWKALERTDEELSRRRREGGGGGGGAGSAFALPPAAVVNVDDDDDDDEGDEGGLDRGAGGVGGVGGVGGDDDVIFAY